MTGSATSDRILATNELSAGYADVNILHDVSIAVPPNGFVCVIGPNGAGKSTLLKTIYGLVPARKGRIRFRSDGQERDITGMPPHILTNLGMNYVPQLDNVFPSMSVLENLEIGAFVRRRDIADSLERVFAWFPMLRDRRRSRAGSLSGGQRHMLALARALMSRPRMLLLDEPSAGLSPAAVEAVFERIAEVNRGGIAILLVEQNARRSLAMSTYAYVLDMGRNRFEGAGADLLNDETVLELYLGGRGRLAAATAPSDDFESGAPPRQP